MKKNENVMQGGPVERTKGSVDESAGTRRTKAGASQGKDRQRRTGLGIVIARLAGFDDSGSCILEWTEGASLQYAMGRTAVALAPEDVGCEVAVGFENGDVSSPIILGPIENRKGVSTADHRDSAHVTYDGRQLVLSAQDEIVLRCGEASIKLTKDGKIFIRGHYLVSRASTLNRIKGGSVQIN